MRMSWERAGDGSVVRATTLDDAACRGAEEEEVSVTYPRFSHVLWFLAGFLSCFSLYVCGGERGEGGGYGVGEGEVKRM